MPEAPHELSRALVLVMALGTGTAVASIYYAQPLLGLLGDSLHEGPRATGLVPTLTQLGYALGILLLAPLGDRVDRRRLIGVKFVLLALALAGSAIAPQLGTLLAASLAIGLSATLAQDIVPAAATLAPDAQRGRVVGTVMTGLLLGILLSRVASGLLGERLGWRAVYAAGAVAVTGVGLACWRALPPFAPTTRVGYLALLATLAQLWRRHARLRQAAWAQGLLSAGFSAFWSTLAVMLEHRFHLGAAAAGAFGLAGAAGALAAPLAGRLADRRGPERVARLGAALAMVSFALLGLGPWLPPTWQVALIVASTLGFDFGIQASLVAHQTVVYGLEPAARSRLNALLITGMFVGMSGGSALGSLALAAWGWHGVVGVCTAAAGGALAVRLWGPGRSRGDQAPCAGCTSTVR